MKPLATMTRESHKVLEGALATTDPLKNDNHRASMDRLEIPSG